MAALAGQTIRNEGVTRMTQNCLQPIAPPVERSRKPPVRVKVRHQPPQRGKMYPPDGERREWWDALKSALGTASSSFVNVSLLQLQAAARLPDGPLSEVAMNAALAMIEAAVPQNEVEGALAVQMACTHCAAMYVLSRVNGGPFPPIRRRQRSCCAPTRHRWKRYDAFAAAEHSTFVSSTSTSMIMHGP